MAADRRALQEWQSRVLDLTTSFAVGALICYRPSLLNPWDITLVQWLVGGVLLRGAIAFYDHLVETLLEISGASLLPTRLTAKPVRYVELDQNSILFLSINSVHEWIFVQRLCHYIWYSPDVSKDLSDIGLLNTLGALYVMFVVLDVCYSPCHHVFHQPWCYPLIHKHHHRQHYPTRGYLDAGNEHPIEHVVGVYSTWAAVLVAVHWTGAHAATIFFFFNLHAAMAMLNHSPYKFSCNILGIKYSVWPIMK
jgi:sterol desaturase/sphingolipid hydroxylase (fatty acid hydroxylase superfamily)